MSELNKTVYLPFGNELNFGNGISSALYIWYRKPHKSYTLLYNDYLLSFPVAICLLVTHVHSYFYLLFPLHQLYTHSKI